MQKPDVILMDIEGTTTSVDFVHKVLFPYSYEHMDEFLNLHTSDKKINELLEQAANLHFDRTGERLSNEKMGAVLKEWIKSDLKATPLKAIQGIMWEQGYKQKYFCSHVYEDVKESWQNWHQQKIILAIYSSGSVAAQKLLFGHTEYGDLNKYLSFYFDTEIGHKKESSSYQKIAEILKVPASKVLFLSDVGDELWAAQTAGMQVIHVMRPQTLEDKRFNSIRNFFELNF